MNKFNTKKKVAAFVALVALMFCPVFFGSHDTSAVKLIKSVRSISPYKYCGYHSGGGWHK